MLAISLPNNTYKNVAGKNFSHKKVGILALQGDMDLHRQALAAFQIEPVLVKMPDQLKGLDGLIIPGGESTTLLKLAEPIGMLPAIKAFAQAGGHIFGTCAGAILLARKVTTPAQQSLDLIDITVERNGYGRQLDSNETSGKSQPPFGNHSLPMTFIRAPKISAYGKPAKVLATYQNEPVLMQENNIMVATFHPELTDDQSVYTYWLNQL